MAALQITIDLPDDLMVQAQREGLMSGEALTGLIRDALRRRMADAFFQTADRVAESAHNLTAEELAEEIRAARES